VPKELIQRFLLVTVGTCLGFVGGFLACDWLLVRPVIVEEVKYSADPKERLVESLRCIDYFRRMDTTAVHSLKKLTSYGALRLDGHLYLASVGVEGYDKKHADNAFVLFPFEGGLPTVLFVYRGEIPTVENLRYIGREYWWRVRFDWAGDDRPLHFDTIIDPEDVNVIKKAHSP
jgi:hypothetical protein